MNNRIAVFGGSFNPPLNSHFSLAEEIINEINDIEKILFVPVSTNYEKNGLISNDHRYNMLKLICDKEEKFDVSDIELKGQKQLHTYETLKLLQKEYPEKELIFVIGTDNLKELYWWGNIDNLLSEFKVLVVARNEDNIDEIIDSQEILKKYRNSFIKYNQQIRSSASASYVRKCFLENKSVRYLLPEEIFKYIKNNNLYRG